MAFVDLDNLLNLYLLTYTDEKFTQLKIFYEEELHGILFRVYQCENTLIVVFSPFNCENNINYLRIGSKIIWQQDMVDCGVGKMNRFFYNVSEHFAAKVRENLQDFSNLIITGMSMGGALGQCFYYHIHDIFDKTTKIYAFGSPRIGDINMRKWFESQKNLTVTNYALFKLVDKKRKIDPVCLFPCCKYGNYVNNLNMTMLYENSVIHQAEYYIEQEDTTITPFSLIYNCGLDKTTCFLWELIHDTDEYYNTIAVL